MFYRLVICIYTCEHDGHDCIVACYNLVKCQFFMFVFSAIHDLYTGRVYVCCLGSRLKNLQDIFS